MKKETDKERILREFMQEHFPYAEFKKAGVFTKEMRNDYAAQAEVICHQLGYKTVFEYGSVELRCHVSYVGERPLHIDENGQLKPEPFITVIPSIYD